MVGMDKLEFMKMADDGLGFGGVAFKGSTIEARFPGTFRVVLLVILDVLDTEDDLEERVFGSLPIFNEASESFNLESGCLGAGFVGCVVVELEIGSGALL